MNIAGVILAGGQARRMGGGDKALLQLGGKPLLRHVIDRFSVQVDVMVLSANGDPARFDAFGLEVVSDSIPDFAGPLAGILAGMDWAAERGHERVVSVAADTPFFPDRLAPGLASAAFAADKKIALAAERGPEGQPKFHPTFMSIHVSLREELREALEQGTRKILDFADQQGAAWMFFDGFGSDLFFNINTPEDLQKAEARLQGAVQ